MNRIKGLSLLMLGIVIGIGLSFSSDIYAATSKLLGERVAKTVTVKLNGESIGQGGIINNTTYLPVRAVVDSINGIEVGKVSSSEVNLVTTTAPERSETAKQEEAAMKKEAEEYSKIRNSLRAQVRDLKRQISEDESKLNIEDFPPYSSYKIYEENFEKNMDRLRPEDKNALEYYKSELERMDKEKADAEKNLPALKSQLEELEKQLTELESQFK